MIGVPSDHTVTENKRVSIALGEDNDVSPARENELLLILRMDAEGGICLINSLTQMPGAI